CRASGVAVVFYLFFLRTDYGDSGEYPAIIIGNSRHGGRGLRDSPRSRRDRERLPITPFLDGHKFDAETKPVRGVAFETPSAALRLADRRDARPKDHRP